MKITARLRNVRLENLGKSSKSFHNEIVAHGDIYEDTKGRFKDGSPVRTSVIQKIEHGIIYTANSVYEID